MVADSISEIAYSWDAGMRIYAVPGGRASLIAPRRHYEWVKPFRIDVPDDVLDDLRQRLARTRWPEAECVDDWSQGIPLEYTRELADYWANDYDWRSRKRAEQIRPVHHRHRRTGHPLHPPALPARGRLPAGDHPRLAGLDRGVPQGDRAAHQSGAHGGAPKTPSTSCARRFPGYGFSGKPTRTGWGVAKIAEAWETLMAPRLRSLRRPGRRLGRRGHHAIGRNRRPLARPST